MNIIIATLPSSSHQWLSPLSSSSFSHRCPCQSLPEAFISSLKKMIILIPHHHYTVCTPIICFYRCKCIFVSLLFHTHWPSSWGVSIATLSSSATCFCQILSRQAKSYLIFYLGHLFVPISNCFPFYMIIFLSGCPSVWLFTQWTE